ncbi:maturase K [Striga asiatica]|uniref:Maturase K n=1 Tax=Striga asiatica TaxID=4170 RepID=A0A5A7P5F0_STRAF|nr:maturase K [Striga asiatica]
MLSIIRSRPFSLLKLLELNLRIHKQPHPLNLQILSKLHPLFLQLHHLPLLHVLHLLVYLTKPLNGLCQPPHAIFPFFHLLRRSTTTSLPFGFLIVFLSLFSGGRRRCRRHGRVIPPEEGLIHSRTLLRQNHRRDHGGSQRLAEGNGHRHWWRGEAQGRRRRHQQRHLNRRRCRRSGPAVLFVGVSRSDEKVEAGEEGPGGGGGIRDLGLLDLVLLLQSVDPVFALDVGAAGLFGVAVEGVDGVGDLLPVLAAEISTVEL